MRYARDFAIPKTFNFDGNSFLANAYLDTYPVTNTREALPTWKLYNLCRLILVATDDLLKTPGVTSETSEFADLNRLLEFNVPDLEVRSEQTSEVLTQFDVARAIRTRFGTNLKDLNKWRHTPTWHQIWMKKQHYHDVKFRRRIDMADGALVFSVENFDKNPHYVLFGIEVRKSAGYKEVVSNANDSIWAIKVAASGELRPVSPRGSSPIKLGPQSFRYFRLDLNRAGTLQSGSYYRLNLLDESRPGSQKIFSTPFQTRNRSFSLPLSRL